MIDFDEIRKEIAIRHNVLIGKDDPVLVTVTLNELVLQRYLALVDKQYCAAARELTVSLQQHVEQSKQTAGKIITEASDYVSEQVRNSIENSMQQAAGELKAEIQSAMVLHKRLLESAEEINAARKVARVSVIMAGISSAIAMGAVIFAIFH